MEKELQVESIKRQILKLNDGIDAKKSQLFSMSKEKEKASKKSKNAMWRWPFNALVLAGFIACFVKGSIISVLISGVLWMVPNALIFGFGLKSIIKYNKYKKDYNQKVDAINKEIDASQNKIIELTKEMEDLKNQIITENAEKMLDAQTDLSLELPQEIETSNQEAKKDIELVL